LTCSSCSWIHTTASAAIACWEADRQTDRTDRQHPLAGATRLQESEKSVTNTSTAGTGFDLSGTRIKSGSEGGSFVTVGARGGSFVTPSRVARRNPVQNPVGALPGRTGGRTRRHVTGSDRQKAYRARKAAEMRAANEALLAARPSFGSSHRVSPQVEMYSGESVDQTPSGVNRRTGVMLLE
jgi:hypothetical protein